MGGGCLRELGRLATAAFLRVGAILVSVLIRGLGFLLLNVLGPLCLGMTRETVQRMVAAWDARWADAGSLAGSRVLYSLASGTLWVVGYIVLSTALCLATWIGRLLFGQIVPVVPVWLCVIAIAGIVFVVGTVVGALAHEYEEELFSG